MRSSWPLSIAVNPYLRSFNGKSLLHAPGEGRRILACACPSRIDQVLFEAGAAHAMGKAALTVHRVLCSSRLSPINTADTEHVLH